MKTELTLELKARFFAQYWGQRILRRELIPEYFYCVDSNFKMLDCWNKNIKSWVELKTLSSISNEDAIEVDFTSSSNFNKCLESYGHEFNDLILKHRDIDYLRSKGYAIHFMGISVEELIEAGWIKLKED